MKTGFAASAVLIALSVAVPAIAAPTTMRIILSGPAEVPPAPAKGHGSARLSLDPAKGQICYTLTAKGTGTPTMAHIHQGAAGVAGPVVVSLDPPASGMSKGCATVAADRLGAIMATPSDYYVNIHTAAHPKGAMRGQLQ